MGKYMRKAKAIGEVAVMEVSQNSSLGVRTRAKTLALKRHLRRSPPPPPSTSGGSSGAASYLQLRSRRLELRISPKLPCSRNPRNASIDAEASPEDAEAPAEKDGHSAAMGEPKGSADCFAVEEASFGENVLELEGRESQRGTRESTPCSLIRDPDVIRTPGSTTRPTSSAEINRRTQNSSQRHIPTPNEMDEFFAGAEVEQQKQFIDKYNFDPVNDKPLPGRYEWQKVDS